MASVRKTSTDNSSEQHESNTLSNTKRICSTVYYSAEVSVCGTPGGKHKTTFTSNYLYLYHNRPQTSVPEHQNDFNDSMYFKTYKQYSNIENDHVAFL